jgi:hypothetical protein
MELEQKLISTPSRLECLMGRGIGVCDPAERQLIRITNPPLQTDELRDEGATHAAIALRALQTVRSRAKGSHVGEEGET